MTRTILFALIISCGFTLKAQHEVGASIGTSQLLGDFGGGVGNGTLFVKDIDLKSFRPAFGVFYRYNFLKVLAVRGQFMYGTLYGNDLYSENEFRYARGLVSKSPVLDLNAQLEINFIPLQFCSGKFKVTPYVAAGVGIAKVNPTVSSVDIGGEFATEELNYIGDNSNQVAITVPLTVGVKFKTKKNLVLGIETSHRLVLEDNLDNYFRQENDQYFFVTANVSYVFCENRATRDKYSKCYGF